jgi:hypothetical protein
MDAPRIMPLAQACSHLAAGHEQLEGLLEQILEIPRTEPERLHELWMPFAAILVAHLDEEDRYMIPALVQVAERDARGIVLEHRHLRARVAQIDMAFSVGTLSAVAVRSFATEVLAHHRRERTLLMQHVGETADVE